MADLAYIDDLHEAALQTACRAYRALMFVEALKADGAGVEAGQEGGKLLQSSAQLYGIPVRHRQPKFILANLADELIADITYVAAGRPRTIAAFAAPAQIARWEKAGVVPQGAYHEAARSLEPSSGQCERKLQLARCNIAHAYLAVLVGELAGALASNAVDAAFDLPAVASASAVANEALARLE